MSGEIRKGCGFGIGLALSRLILGFFGLGVTIVSVIWMKGCIDAKDSQGIALRRSAPSSVQPPPSTPDTRIDASTASIVRGDLQVWIGTASVESVPIVGAAGHADYVAETPKLVLRVGIRNLSPTASHRYETWSGSLALEDDRGGRYGEIEFADGQPRGRTRGAVVLPGHDVTDVLVFPPPARDARWLRLELPGRNIGSSDGLRFEIPGSMIRGL